MNRVNRVLIYLSGFIPLWLIMYASEMNFFSKGEIHRVWNLNKIFWLITIIISFISFVALLTWLHSIEDVFETDCPPQLDMVIPKDIDVINFYVTYVIPLIVVRIESWPSIIAGTMSIIIVGIVNTRRNNMHLNIMLIILGYRIYYEQWKYMIISREDIQQRFCNNLKEDNEEGLSDKFEDIEYLMFHQSAKEDN